MREQKYPPGVRFVFLLLLSLWIFMLIGIGDGGSWPDQLNNLIFAFTSTVSLVLLIIGLLPWAKKRRARALIPGLVLFLSGLPFFVEIV